MDRAIIFCEGGNAYFRPYGNCSLNHKIPVQELQSAIDNDLVDKHLDSKPGLEIYIFRVGRGRRLLSQLKNRFGV